MAFGPKLATVGDPAPDHPRRAAVDAALVDLLTPSVTGLLIIAANRDAGVTMRAVPDIDPLVDGMLVAACEERGVAEV